VLVVVLYLLVVLLLLSVKILSSILFSVVAIQQLMPISILATVCIIYIIRLMMPGFVKGLLLNMALMIILFMIVLVRLYI